VAFWVAVHNSPPKWVTNTKKPGFKYLSGGHSKLLNCAFGKKFMTCHLGCWGESSQHDSLCPKQLNNTMKQDLIHLKCIHWFPLVSVGEVTSIWLCLLKEVGALSMCFLMFGIAVCNSWGLKWSKNAKKQSLIHLKGIYILSFVALKKHSSFWLCFWNRFVPCQASDCVFKQKLFSLNMFLV
jgi:hypothetical protein